MSAARRNSSPDSRTTVADEAASAGKASSFSNDDSASGVGFLTATSRGLVHVGAWEGGPGVRLGVHGGKGRIRVRGQLLLERRLLEGRMSFLGETSGAMAPSADRRA